MTHNTVHPQGLWVDVTLSHRRPGRGQWLWGWTAGWTQGIWGNNEADVEPEYLERQQACSPATRGHEELRPSRFVAVTIEVSVIHSSEMLPSTQRCGFYLL